MIHRKGKPGIRVRDWVVGPTIKKYVPTVFKIACDNSNIYAAGNFKTAGTITVNGIAKWDGTSWSALGTGMNGIVYDIFVNTYDHTVYVVGDFTTAGGTVVNHIAKWDGTSWSAIGSGTNGTVFNIDQYFNIGGGFTTADGTLTNNIAQWQ